MQMAPESKNPSSTLENKSESGGLIALVEYAK